MTDKRSHSEAFPDEEDQWIFDPQLDAAIPASRQDEDEDDNDQRGGPCSSSPSNPRGLVVAGETC